MTSATAASSDHHRRSHRHLCINSIAQIDLRLLSQSELLSLSLSSPSPSDHRRRCDDDVLIPKIDRSVFNESAGSRKQTYSRLRLAPPRNSQPSSSAALAKLPTRRAPDPVDVENTLIIGLLRELFMGEASSSESGDLVPVEVGCRESMLQPSDSQLQDVPIKVVHYRPLFGIPEALCSNVASQHPLTAVVDRITKRKRGRPRKYENQMTMSELESKPVMVSENKETEKKMVLVNKNGVVVDLESLRNLGEPFGEEFRRMTHGIDTEDELLGFLSGLNGEWGSCRKKRRIVDASDFGDALPLGWKLMLSIKRKGDQLCLSCRRYISPTGQQFVSVKEVSSYLVSYFGLEDANLANSVYSDDNNQLAFNQTVGDLSCKDGKNACPSVPVLSLPSDHGKQVALSRTGAPVELQGIDILKCHKCPQTFSEKDDLLHHLLTSHKRDSRLPKPKSSISEEVIMKDGKYECQFCHKQFDQRNHYYGHLGVHIKDYVKRIDASSRSVTIQREMLTASTGPEISRMQASSEIDPGTSESFSESPSVTAENAGTGKCNETHAKMMMETNRKIMIEEELCDKDGVEIEKATALSAAELHSLGEETFSCCSKNNVVTESSNDDSIVKCKISEKNVGPVPKRDSQDCLLPTMGDEQVLFFRNNITGASINYLAKHEQESSIGNVLHTLISEEKICSDENIKKSVSNTIEEPDSNEGNKGRTHNLVYGLGRSCTEQNDVNPIINRQKGDISSVPPNGIKNVTGISTNGMDKSLQEYGTECNFPTSASERTLVFNNNVNSASSSLDGSTLIRLNIHGVPTLQLVLATTYGKMSLL